MNEATNGIRWKIVPELNDSAVLEAGMITSYEPGFYAEGLFGIRHVILMLTQPFGSSEFGNFLYNEPLTLVPFDVRGLDLYWMNEDEQKLLNNHHLRVFEEISPLLSEEETLWLKEKTRAV